ncbi:PREDICTED: thioredoxin-like protein AAED1 [Calidris pugnax]|uniref:thioredoxin-like protein AAED1 n=1 Tax=Calidris pugnax TaxID=198806 RepID=UPI00071DC5EA|nr:PREDICTED: thioredoxin-like protein AAED1 [Calidris pugnax]
MDRDIAEDTDEDACISSEMFQARGSAPLKGLQPMIDMVRTPLKGYSALMITSRTGTFPNGLWLTENTCRGRSSPKGTVTYAETGAEENKELREASRCPVVDADGRSVPFEALYGQQKAIVVFVRNFLCYTCKEYVEDLAKVPKAFLQEANVRLIVIGQSSYHHIKPFCSLTGYTHEMYVDPQREIYKILGMKRGEGNNVSVQSPHVKSNALLGSIRSVWRAMTGPAFDFQGDPAQQGGALILGPGNEVHFLHLDKNRLDHVPINTVLQLAGVKTVNFTHKPQIIDI